MQCEEIRLELLAYGRGELPASLRAAVAEHLSSCPTCAQEAAAMNKLGQELRIGLNEWANEGICPPDVLSRIETGIRTARNKQRKNSWPIAMGTVAAAAVLLFIVYGQSIDLSQQLAALPLVGGLAAHLLPDEAADPGSSARPVVMNTPNGTALTVMRLQTSNKETVVQYALRGPALDPTGDYMMDKPVLQSPGGAIPLQALDVTPTQGGVNVEAHFAPVPAGIPLTFMIGTLPTTRGTRETGPWQVTLQN